MRKFSEFLSDSRDRKALDLARVLLVHGELAPRLALQTILQAGGYAVDVAGTPAEALCKLDAGQYELVLSDSDIGSQPSGRNVLAYARIKQYRPATALVTSSDRDSRSLGRRRQISIHTEDVSLLLAEVAELIGIRASRRYRPLRQAV